MVTISNESLEASFHRKGAELCSLQNKASGIEYIWQADQEYWGRHAPILFPFVGKLKENTFLIDSQPYHQNQHGFARDMDFQIFELNNDSVSFELVSNEDTLKIYPFEFRLLLTYQLSGKSLIVKYDVSNRDTGEIYFSIGGHPAFNCPHVPDKKRSDYQLIFEKEENVVTHLLQDGLFSGENELAISGKTLKISDDLFDKDALVLKSLESNYVILNDGTEDILKFEFEGFPYLGIWSKNQKAPFVCIEPWFGLADHVDHNLKIEEKEGIEKLNAGQNFSCKHVIEVF